MERYRSAINGEISLYLERLLERNRLSEAIAYSLLSGGKRLRPILVLIIADAIGNLEGARKAAFAVECFHTASLIADDLPCMDDDDFRRERPSLHKVFGQDIALLASYTLIAAGYEAIGEGGRNAEKGEDRVLLALETIGRSAGLKGATGGQFLDLHAENKDLETVLTIIERKTVTLFQLSFSLGWIFGGGSMNEIGALEETAAHLGRAFQVADDLEDMGQKKGTNIASLLGKEGAFLLFQKEMELFVKGAKRLSLWKEPLESLVTSFLQPIVAGSRMGFGASAFA